MVDVTKRRYVLRDVDNVYQLDPNDCLKLMMFQILEYGVDKFVFDNIEKSDPELAEKLVPLITQ